MFKMLKMIAGNIASGPVTVRLPGTVATPDAYRGAVTMNPEKCLGCGMCSYVCVSNAITATDQGKTYTWAYEPGRCTFCARCVDRCAGHALSMDSAQTPCYEHRGDLAVEHVVEFPPCSECGEPVRTAGEEFLGLAFDHVIDETRELVRLCERCRRRRLQRSLVVQAFQDGKEKNR